MSSKLGAYQDQLARSTMVTSFSYFEAYVKDVLSEMVNFHGGKSAIQIKARKRISSHLKNPTTKILTAKRKLQDSFDKSKIQKYQKYTDILDQSGFDFPTDLMANFGVKHLIDKLDEKRGMRAWEIPEMLTECLLFDLAKGDRTLFEDARDVRNKISHGKASTIKLKEALRYASAFHTVAAKIDRHVLEHFFVLQDV